MTAVYHQEENRRGGYYDRLLARARPDAPLVAIGFDCQVFEEIPVASHDVFMDLVLTEARTITGKGRSAA